METMTYRNNLETLFKEISCFKSDANTYYMNTVIDLLDDAICLSRKHKETYLNSIELLYNDLSTAFQIYKKSREKAQRYKSIDFNVFSILKYNENIFSDIIADMLDPEGSHGQKDVFLEAFLNLIANKNTHKIKLFNNEIEFFRKNRREEGTEENRRIDIYIEFHDGFILAIENKIGAGDQFKQVEHYIAEINKRKGGERDDFLFIYLTTDGHNPDETSITTTCRKYLENKGLFLAMSYKEDIALWLQECIIKCKSVRYRYFLRDMKDTISNWP